MLWETKQAVQNSLREFAPALRARHHIVKLASGKWTRTLGPPGDTEKHRVVNVKGREWKQVPRHVETDREWWQTKAVHHATKKSPAQLQREIDDALSHRKPRGPAHKSKMAHATKAEGPQLLARWESRTGKHWVELTQHTSVTIANTMDPTSVGGREFTWYGYTSPGSSGSLNASTSAAAIAEMEQRVKRGDFLPDAAKTPMKRVR